MKKALLFLFFIIPLNAADIIGSLDNLGPKVLLFDFDGTLANTPPIVFAFVNEKAKDYDLKKVEEKDIPALRDMSARDMFSHLGVGFFNIGSFMKGLKVYLENNVGKTETHKGLRQVLKKLQKQGWTLGILTSSSHKRTQAFLERHDMNFFDFVYKASSRYGKGKHLSDIKSKASGSLYYIGDQIRDIKGARDAGIPIISVAWGFNSEKALRAESPDYIVNKPQELLGVLGSLG